MTTYIERVEHLTIYEASPSGPVTRPKAAPVPEVTMPEATGSPIPTALDPIDESEHGSYDEEAERVESLRSALDQDVVDMRMRQTYLIKLVEEVGKQRSLESLVTTHQTEPDDRPSAERANIGRQDNAAETLNRACAICKHAGNCAIRGNLGDWIATKPSSNKKVKIPYSSRLHPSVKRAEPRMKFLDRVAADPLAHCIPGYDDKKTA